MERSGKLYRQSGCGICGRKITGGSDDEPGDPAFAEPKFTGKGQNMDKKLRKSATDRKIAGVCGGIAEYFDVDPTAVRLAWVLVSCIGGSGLLAYIIAAIIMPEAQG